MKAHIAARVLIECEPDVQQNAVKDMKPKRLASILERMAPGDAANILSDYPLERRLRVLRTMQPLLAGKVEEMLGFKKGSIARVMSEEYIALSASCSVASALEQLRSRAQVPSNLYYIYLVDEDGALVGVVSLKHLIVSSPDRTLAEIMTTKVIQADLASPLPVVERMFTKFDLMALPVVDLAKHMRGVVNAEDLLEIVVSARRAEEHKSHHSHGVIPHHYDHSNRSRTGLRSHSIVREVGQFIKDLEQVKPRKSDYLNHAPVLPMMPLKDSAKAHDEGEAKP